MAVAKIAGVIRTFVECEVGSIEPCPGFLFFVPPDKLLAFTPGLPIGASGRAVINDAAVVGPRESPPTPKIVVRSALVRLVHALFWIDAAVNPAAACSRAVILELVVGLELGAIVPVPAVNLTQNLIDIWFGMLTMSFVIPGDRVERCV